MANGSAWTARETALLGTMTDKALAAKINRTHRAVSAKRESLSIAANVTHRRKWTAKELKLLGTMSDSKLAEKLGCRRLHVAQTRARHGVECFSPTNRPGK